MYRFLFNLPFLYFFAYINLLSILEKIFFEKKIIAFFFASHF